jgi:DNA-binding SARP family transcriptional activator/TolB-like protein
VFKPHHVTLRLLGSFAIEADADRPYAIAIRSQKGRALLAYLAMKPDYRARREELATLFWGDTTDGPAHHSLRQCLLSLRQDLRQAAEIVTADRETIGLRTQCVAVDACTFLSLARSTVPDDLARAAELWHEAFLPDVVLDIEEFDSWRRHEADRLAAVAGKVFEALCRHADANGDGERAVATAERLLALEPTREDRQRIALQLVARHQGRQAALSRAKLFTDRLRAELGVSPEAATRALIEAIRRGDFETAPGSDRQQPAARGAVEAVRVQDAATPARDSPAIAAAPANVPSRLVTVPAQRAAASASLPFWRRRPRAAAWSAMALLLFGAIAAAGIAIGPRLQLALTVLQRGHAIVVLPFVADSPGQPDDPAFARLLTHDLIGYLSRFGDLRVISEHASDSYGDGQTDVARLRAELGAQYAIVGHVQGHDNTLRIDFQLVDTATRTNLWSDGLEQTRSDPTLVADEAARGISRMLAFEIANLGALPLRASPMPNLTVGELIARGNLALAPATMPQNLSDAMTAFAAAQRRDPHNESALLGIARVRIVAAMNFVDLELSADLNETEQLLKESLARSPNSTSALYSLSLLEKFHGQYQAGMRTSQRCLEINPSFLPAQGQIGNLLTRIGLPEQGLQQILRTIRTATPNDPTKGFWYLFAADAELELGHDAAALDWVLRANTVLPEAPLVQAWLAGIYATLGDERNAAKHVAALAKIAPVRTRMFIDRTNNYKGRSRIRIFDGLRLALGQTLS